MEQKSTNSFYTKTNKSGHNTVNALDVAMDSVDSIISDSNKQAFQMDNSKFNATGSDNRLNLTAVSRVNPNLPMVEANLTKHKITENSQEINIQEEQYNGSKMIPMLPRVRGKGK